MIDKKKSSKKKCKKVLIKSTKNVQKKSLINVKKVRKKH